MARKSFVFRLEWFKSLSAYPAEVRLEVYEATMRYALSGTLSELKPLSSMAFTFIKNALDADFEKYNDISDKRRAAGQKGRAIASKCKQMISSKQMISENVLLYDTDTVSDTDTDTPCVCVNSAQARASTPPAPHTDFDFFFPTFWKANIFQPAAETQRFIDYYEASGWALEKGDLLDSDAKRLAKARIWKPKKEGARFPPRFAEIWSELAEQAPDNIRRQMYEDGVAVHMESRSVCTSIEVTREVKQWLIDSSNAAARELILGKWLHGNKNKPVQFPVYD